MAKAQLVARLPDDHRAATLFAFMRTPEASAGDDVIDLFNAVGCSFSIPVMCGEKEESVIFSHGSVVWSWPDAVLGPIVRNP